MPVLHNQDYVCIANCGQTVGNDKACPSLPQLIKCLINHGFGSGIYRTCCLIQNENIRFHKKCPADRQQLLFSGRKAWHFIGNYSLITIRQCTYKLIHEGLPACIPEFFFRDFPFQTIFQIVSDRSFIHPGVLQNHCNVLPQACSCKVVNFYFVIKNNFSNVYFIKSFNQIYKCCLAGTSSSNNSDHLARFYNKVHMFNQLPLRYIRKAHIPEIDLSLQPVALSGFRFFFSLIFTI